MKKPSPLLLWQAVPCFGASLALDHSTSISAQSVSAESDRSSTSKTISDGAT
jgi:hypothetical protein